MATDLAVCKQQRDKLLIASREEVELEAKEEESVEDVKEPEEESEEESVEQTTTATVAGKNLTFNQKSARFLNSENANFNAFTQKVTTKNTNGKDIKNYTNNASFFASFSDVLQH